jgi:hypothetical protein
MSGTNRTSVISRIFVTIRPQQSTDYLEPLEPFQQLEILKHLKSSIHLEPLENPLICGQQNYLKPLEQLKYAEHL